MPLSLRAATVLAPLLLLPPSSCALDSEPAAAGAPSSAEDAGAPKEAVEAGPDASGSTTRSWSFESASADCNGWVASNATSIRAVPSHSGAYACKLCADGGEAEMSLSRALGPLERGTWVLRAFLRRHPKTTAAIRARVTLQTFPDGGAAAIALSDGWTETGDVLELREAAEDPRVAIAFLDVEEGACVLIDDVTVERR